MCGPGPMNRWRKPSYPLAFKSQHYFSVPQIFWKKYWSLKSNCFSFFLYLSKNTVLLFITTTLKTKYFWLSHVTYISSNFTATYLKDNLSPFQSFAKGPKPILYIFYATKNVDQFVYHILVKVWAKVPRIKKKF